MEISIRQRLEIISREGYFTFFKKVFSHILSKLSSISSRLRYNLWRLLIFFYIVKFRGLIKTIQTTKKAIEFVFSFNYRGLFFKPSQIKEEIVKLVEIVENLEPKIIIEIGTNRGGTLFLFSRMAESEAVIISIDLPGTYFGNGYPKYMIRFYESFSREKQRIYLIRGDSQEINTLKRVKEILKDFKIDFLFIDGDHSYGGVKKDFENYSPLVKKDGIIAFHDIVPGPEEAVGNVPKFWNEIKNSYINQEIVKSWEQGGYGIGLLFV